MGTYGFVIHDDRKSWILEAFLKFFFPASIFLFLLAGCGGSSGGTTSSNSPADGVVQKGPFIARSTICTYELDDFLNQTGISYETQTKDDLGAFSIPPNVQARFVEIQGYGFYFDELANGLSSARILLRSIADLSSNRAPSLNVLTTLQADRFKKLLKSGLSYSDAYRQSRDEVLNCFGFPPSSINGLGSLNEMRIDGAKDQDGVLLSASVILLQLAHTRANGSQTVPAELSLLLGAISEDLKTYGAIQDSALIESRRAAAQAVDVAKIRQNIESFYSSLGFPMLSPNFEEWVDDDGSGLVPERRRASPNPFELNPIMNVAPLAICTSNQITIAGLGHGQYVTALVSSNAALIKNGQVLSRKFGAVADGDTLAVQVTSAQFPRFKNWGFQAERFRPP